MKRRTIEDKKEVLKLKETVIKKIKLHNIKPNKISSNVSNISHPTIVNILNGKTQFPSLEKLKSVHNFIINNYENKSGKEVTSTLSQDEKLDKIIDLLEHHSVKLEIIFEILSSETDAKHLINELVKDKDLVQAKREIQIIK
jgi:antirestriction protein